MVERCIREGVGAASPVGRPDRFVAERGRMAWEKATSHGRRFLAETAVGQHKAIAGPRLRARGSPTRQGEGALATGVLNHMIRAAQPAFVRVA